MVLHTVNKPGEPLRLCLASHAPDDAVLLIEDGVHAVWGQQATALAALRGGIYVLAEDVALAGINRPLPAWTIPVDYAGFVELVVAGDKMQSWF